MKTIHAQCKAMLSAGDSIEEVLAFLQQEGYSRIDSIKAVMALEDKTLAEAKGIVHYSETWKEARERANVFQDSLIDALEQKSESH